MPTMLLLFTQIETNILFRFFFPSGQLQRLSQIKDSDFQTIRIRKFYWVSDVTHSKILIKTKKSPSKLISGSTISSNFTWRSRSGYICYMLELMPSLNLTCFLFHFIHKVIMIYTQYLPLKKKFTKTY